MKSLKEVIVLSLCLSLILSPTMVMAAPQGGKVVGGSASIHHSGATTTINQSSDRAIINWNSFDIAKHEAVRHNMPSASSAGLHRVVGGGGASQIRGLLQSNGNIYLVNPAGVVIHKGAKVDTNGFIATTRDIADSNFMQGKMDFDKPGLAGAQIINKGEITVRESGLAALVAPTVRNEGLIAAKLGKVALASSDAAWSLDMHGDDLITFTMDENAVNSLYGVDGKPLASVENSGSIKAEGGVVVLTAAQLDGIVGSVVNSGEISAASAEVSGGLITFKGQGTGVDVVNTGAVDVSSAVADAGSVRMDTDGKLSSSGQIAATGGRKGGKVTLTGTEVALKGTANIDASGNTGGGTVLVGGNRQGKGPERNAETAEVERGAAIHADARIKGDGGQVVIWSDEKTSFDGTITAQGGSEGGNGGQVETSGKTLKVGETAWVSTAARNGLFGNWLLDPEDFVIAASGGDTTGSALSSLLAGTNVEVQSISGQTEGNGDIIVNDAVSWSADTTLILNAERNVTVNADITAIGENAGLRILPQNGDFEIFGAKVTLSGDNPSLYISGKEYKVIDSIEEFQDLNLNWDGFYALGLDIDAHVTSSWTNENGYGFTPITIRGKLNGLGHTISNLYMKIDSGDEYSGDIGIIKLNSGLVNNLNIDNCSINVNSEMIGRFGGFIGWNQGKIENVNYSGKIGVNLNRFSVYREDNIMEMGGLVGSNDGVIYNCFIDGNVNVRSSQQKVIFGGICGTMISDGVVENSGTNLNVQIELDNVGRNEYGMALYAGGFVGKYSPNTFGKTGGKIESSYALGSIHIIDIFNGYGGKNSVGGFVGWMSEDLFHNTNIKNCYNKIDISLTGSGYSVGGFAGHLNSYIFSYDKCILNNYSAGRIDILGGNNDYDGFIGNFSSALSALSGCFYDIDNSGMPSSPYATGLTTSQMMSRQSYTGWDFENVWTIDEGKSYPQLRHVKMLDYVEPDPTPTPNPEPTPGSDTTPDLDPDWSISDYIEHVKSNVDKYINKGIVYFDTYGGLMVRWGDDYYLGESENYSEFSEFIEKQNITGEVIHVIEDKGSTRDYSEVNTEQKLSDLIEEINNLAHQVIESIDEEFQNLFTQSMGNVHDEAKDALARIKSEARFHQLSVGKSVKLPDGIFDAIAEIIFDAMGASKVKKYADNPNAFAKQIYGMIRGGSKNKNSIITIDGITYTINVNAFLFGGAGFSDAPVQWKDERNKIYSGSVIWSSSPDEISKLIADYCIAMARINTEAWEEASLYFLTGSKLYTKAFDIGSDVIRAICDIKAGNELSKKIGKQFEREYRSGLFGLGNTFKTFVRNLPDGDKIIELSEMLLKTKDACNILERFGTDLKDYKKDREDFLSLYSALRDEYNFSTKQLDSLSLKLTELDMLLVGE